MKTRRQVLSWAAALPALPLLNLMPSAARASAPVKVGYLIPLSGTAAASIGQEMSRATHLAVKHINEGGGIKSLGGAPIELVEVDSHGDPQVGITEAERLITVDKVPVMVGAFQSAVTFPATTVAEKYRIPWLVDLAAKSEITERGFKYVFRGTQIPSSGNALSIVDFVSWASQKTGKRPRSVAIVYENTDWGLDLAKTLRAKFKAMNLDLVFDEAYPPNAADLRPLVLKLKGTRPDIITFTSYTGDAIHLQQLVAQTQLDAMAVIGSGAGQIDRTFVPTVGEKNTNYSFTTSGWAGYDSTITTPFAKRFWNDYVAQGKGDPTELSVSAYGTMWILKDALERAGTTKPDAIRDAIAKTRMKDNDLTKLLGYDVYFDQKGQNPSKRYVVQQIVDAKYKTVWPENLAVPGYHMTYPMPLWSARK